MQHFKTFYSQQISSLWPTVRPDPADTDNCRVSGNLMNVRPFLLWFLLHQEENLLLPDNPGREASLGLLGTFFFCQLND